MSTPSTRERQVQERMDALGSTTLVALELGVSRITVDVTLAHYHQKACGPLVAELEARIEDLEAERDALLRAPQRIVFIDHRRVADGGRTKRQQMREARAS